MDEDYEYEDEEFEDEEEPEGEEDLLKKFTGWSVR